jgi:diguanylate cyclase (GGDEF)-like protein/PAS domain S-box-containing protein
MEPVKGKNVQRLGLDTAARMRRRLIIERGATTVLAESNSLAEGAPKIIRQVCETLAWECGTCWAVGREGHTMQWAGGWGAALPGVAEFLEVSQKVPASGLKGDLICGAWADGEPGWVRDVTEDKTFRRAKAALEAGLHSAFAFPIKAGTQVIGVMEFFSHEIHEPDPDLLDCMRYIGSQLGQFCQRTCEQERLRESEERFQSTTDMAAIGIAQVDTDGQFIFTNRRLCELLGYTREELRGLSVKQISHPDDRNVTDEARALLWAGKINSFQVEKRYLRKDGSTVWVGLNFSVKRTPSGDPQYDIVVFEDITTRKRAEQLLRLEHNVTRCLAEAETESAALQAVMGVLCENQGWPFGEYWRVDEQAGVLRFGALWENLGPELRHLFEQAQQHVFAPGVGLAGRVWQTGEPLWIADISADSRMLRKELAHAAGLRGAFLFPVVAAGKTIGVFSFWSRAIREPDERMLEAIRVVGSQIGQFLRRKQAEEHMQYLATHDGLTRLPNRVLFSELLNVSIESARRHGRMFAVEFIDLDQFKVINDTLGHQAGDQLLREVSARLKETLRSSDVVARLGGDEFVVLLQEVPDADKAGAVARKILSAIIKPIVIAGQECRVTASIGISMYPADGQDEQSLMKNADIAMYFAKEGGRNNFQFYSKDARP